MAAVKTYLKIKNSITRIIAIVLVTKEKQKILVPVMILFLVRILVVVKTTVLVKNPVVLMILVPMKIHTTNTMRVK